MLHDEQLSDAEFQSGNVNMKFIFSALKSSYIVVGGATR